MAKITAKVTFDKFRATAKIKAASDEALTMMGNQALQDATKYVPEDQGYLKDSGISHSDQKAVNGVFRMRWEEPYSQYLWNGKVMRGNPANRDYGPKKLTFTAEFARAEWAKYAQKVHGEEWKKVYEAAFQRELRK
ncbi:MAG: hypothetical protein IJ471_00630 [Eubacterium sp.]|nr:hypothetical protein [Eubacterium sp.]